MAPSKILLSAIACALVVAPARALFGLDGSGGTFRYGHVHYRVVRENTVEFTIEAAFTRKVGTSYFYGSALDGYAQLGDKITMTGRETPEFDYGDNKVLRKLTMDVTAYSEREDWVMGKVVVQHKYDTPSNSGNPWLARFTGCCRYSKLLNNGDAPWELIAQVNLGEVSASPRVSVLPVISVPRETLSVGGEDSRPGVTIPATITVPGEAKKTAMHWSTANPFNVGNAAAFSNGFASLSLAPFMDKIALKCCTEPDASECPQYVKKNPSVSQGCLARMLRTDYQPRDPTAPTVSPAMTVEGWVKIRTAEGGVVLSTGRPSGRTCTDKGSCSVALIYVKVNATHVSVGHERALDEEGENWELQTVDFSIDSSDGLVQQLSDDGFYIDSEGPSLLNKFVHVMVVRKSLVGSSHYIDEGDVKHDREYWFSTYKVYVNGFMLEVAKFPFCAAGAKCTNGARYGGFASKEIVDACGANPIGLCGCYDDTAETKMTESNGCKVELTIGESNPVPGPRQAHPVPYTVPFNFKSDETNGKCSIRGGMCEDNFGNETALLFGAYRGADAHQPESHFDGLLDEWRIWNGERSRADLLDAYRRPIYPSMSNNYGDPTIIPDASGKGKMIDVSNYQTASVLMALYSFDWSKARAVDPDGCPSKQINCKFVDVQPTFPLKPQDAPQDWIASWTATVDSGDAVDGHVKHAETDPSGVMFFQGGDLYSIDDQTKGVLKFGRSRPAPGKYHVTVYVSEGELAPSVPVDFIIEIVDSIYETGQIGYQLNDQTKYPINDFIPELKFEAPVRRVAGDDSMVEFAGRDEVEDEQWTLFDEYSYPAKAKAFAGFLVEVRIVGSDMQGVTSPTLFDPTGLDADSTWDWKDTKVGFSIGPAPASARFTSVKDTNPSQMMMSWTPCAYELGATIVCMDAVDYHIQRSPDDPNLDKVDNPASSNMRCLQFQVEEDPPPRFADDIPTKLNLIMGRESTIDLRAWDGNCLDAVTIGLNSTEMLPPGASLDDQMPAAGFSTECPSQKRTLRWTPSVKMGGFKGKTCFDVTDTGGSQTCGAGAVVHTSTHCVEFEVARCKYALQEDQQLQEISALFGVDWMRLWSLNMNMTHPDYVVYKQQVVWIGHRYTVAPNERMDVISRRLGMSVQQLRDLNFDIARKSTVETGQELCVVPNSCVGEKDTFYSSMVYKNDKFFAASKAGQ